MTRRPARELGWAAAALAAGVFFLFWPALGMPPIIDDVDFAFILGFLDKPHFWTQLAELANRCLLPIYFRPLLIPVFLAWRFLFGLSPFALRLTMLLLHLGSIAAVFELTRRMTRDSAASFLAACLYGLSWIHWDTFASIANVGESFMALFLWIALLAWFDHRENGFWRGLVWASLAALFKESAVAFAPLALAIRPPWRESTGAGRLRALAPLAWAGVYLSIRCFALPRSPMANTFYELDWAGVFSWRPYWLVVETGIAPLLHPAPLTHQLCVFQESITEPGRLAVWIVPVLLLAAALGWAVREFLAQESGRLKPDQAAAVVRFALCGLAAGVLPYAVFRGAMAPEDAHRFTIAWGALCVALGTGFAAVLRWPGRATPAFSAGVCFAAALWLFAATALRLRYQDAGSGFGYRESVPGPLSLRIVTQETQLSLRAMQRQISSRLKEGDAFVFEGFPQVLRIPYLYQALERKRIRLVGAGDPEARWVLRRRDVPIGVELSIQELPAGRPQLNLWTKPAACGSRLYWDLLAAH